MGGRFLVLENNAMARLGLGAAALKCDVLISRPSIPPQFVSKEEGKFPFSCIYTQSVTVAEKAGTVVGKP